MESLLSAVAGVAIVLAYLLGYWQGGRYVLKRLNKPGLPRTGDE